MEGTSRSAPWTLVGNSVVPEELIRVLTQALSAGNAFLVTGAGFSYGGTNVDGDPIPSTGRLTELLHATYSTGAPAERASLGDVFDLARLRDADAVSAIVERTLHVPPHTELPEYFQHYLALPWSRIFTFNLDDLLEAVAEQNRIDLSSASALRSVPSADIRYVHVNGDRHDGVEATFSDRQYAHRLALRDPWLLTMGSELLNGVVVYVGTTLQEMHMWSAIEARRLDSVGALDPRPISFLITPGIDDTRREMLAYSQVEWVKMDAREFAEQVLAPVVARRPTPRRVHTGDAATWWQPVGSEAEEEQSDSRYLLGQQPTWSDVQQVAVAREFEARVVDWAEGRAAVITGTPGSGKTTTAMKAALALRAEGQVVRFVDVEDVDSYRSILDQVIRTADPYCLVIDNAELLGAWAPSIANEFLQKQEAGRLVMSAPRNRVAALRLDDFRESPRVIDVPLLEPSDVAGLVTMLGRFDLLGDLDGLARTAQERELAARSGRELLVAMIRATKGVEHEERVSLEYESLGPSDRSVYGVVALARDLRYRLKQSELLIAVGKEGLLPLERLLDDGTVLKRDGLIQPRHARIAEIVVATMQSKGELLQAWIRLTQGLAVGHDIANRHTRVTRAITRLISHDEVRRYLGVDGSRQFYAAVADHLRSDHHYWLQRGSFELGAYNGAPAARRFLETSRTRAGGDPFVEVAWGNLLFAEALQAEPAQRQSLGLAAFTHTAGLFGGFGLDNPYPFGVAAKGCLQLAESAGLPRQQKGEWLRRALNDVLDQGIRAHPHDGELKELRRKVLDASATRKRSPRRPKRNPKPRPARRRRDDA